MKPPKLKLTLNIFLSVVLLVSVSLSVISVIQAAAPNPGHTWSEIGDVLVSLTSQVTGVLPLANGGNGATPGAADQVAVTDSTSVATWRTLPDCSGNGKALRFNASTNTFDCNTLQFYNQSVSTASGFASDTYLSGSGIAVPSTGMQAGTRYHAIFYVSKTAAGTATPTINIRYGTGNTVSDTSRCLMTFASQTAVVDTGTFDVWVTFRTVGSGTSAIMQCVGQLRHNGTSASAAAVGLGGMFVQTVTTTGGGFDSTVGNSYISTSVNGGTSASWTITLVQSELTNLN